MTAKQSALKKYIVKLSAEERVQLTAMIKKGKAAARKLLKARILLKADASKQGDSWSDSQIAEALDTTTDTVRRTRQQLVEEGLEAALTRKHSPNSARPRIFDGAAEAKLIALACSPPPKGRKRWTLTLLESAVVELNIVEHASDNTIGRALKKRSPPAPPQAVGHPTGAECRLRRRYGGRARSLSATARPQEAAHLPRRQCRRPDYAERASFPQDPRFPY